MLNTNKENNSRTFPSDGLFSSGSLVFFDEVHTHLLCFNDWLTVKILISIPLKSTSIHLTGLEFLVWTVSFGKHMSQILTPNIVINTSSDGTLLKHPRVNQNKALQRYAPHAKTLSFVFVAAVIIIINPLAAVEFPLLWLTHHRAEWWKCTSWGWAHYSEL